MALKHCSKCNTTFECCSDKEGCWCENLAVSLETLNALRNQFENCLCPSCLTEYSSTTH